MRGSIAVARREIKSFFVSPVAYFVITGFALLSGFFFFNLLGWFQDVIQRYQSMPFGGSDIPNLNEWVVESFFQTMMVVLVFLIPMLTMRIIAEEKRRGTFELLVTSPLSVFDIVFGKFIGVSFVLAVMMVLMFAFPALLIFYGDPIPEIPPMITGFFGVFLCALAFTSIGMAISSFTENQIVAAVSSMVILLLLYVIQSPAENIGGTTGEILTYLSPVLQLRDMLKGVVTLKALVYFLSVITFGLFLSQRALEAYRWR